MARVSVVARAVEPTTGQRTCSVGRAARPTGTEWAAIVLVALLARVVTAYVVDGPGYLDAAYPIVVGRQIASGHGLTEPIVWHWLAPPASLPHPSNDYWPPLGALVVGASLALLGDSFRAAQLPNAVAGVALPLIALWLATVNGLDRRGRWCAALLTLAAGPLFAHWSQPDAFALFAVVGALALGLTERPGGRAAVAVGVLAGVGHLTRVDGALLLLPLAAFAVVKRDWWRLGVSVGAFVMVVGPWLLRNWTVFGAPLESSGIAPLTLAEYDDLFRPGGTPLAEYLNRGVGSFLAERAAALWFNTVTLGSFLHYYLLPCAVVGAWLRREQSRAALMYLAALAAFMTLVAPLAGARGSFLHSLSALLPTLCVWAMVGVERTADALARWRKLPPVPARRNLSVIAVVGALTASIGLGARFIEEWRGWSAQYRQAATLIAAHELHAVVVAADPATYSVVAHSPAVAMPNLPLPDALAFVGRYDAQYLVVGPARPASWTEFDGDADPPGLIEIGRVGDARVYRMMR